MKTLNQLLQLEKNPHYTLSVDEQALLNHHRLKVQATVDTRPVVVQNRVEVVTQEVTADEVVKDTPKRKKRSKKSNK